MVLSRSISPGDEVYNTYGSRLSNAILLARYGFILEGNEWDVVCWTPEELNIHSVASILREIQMMKVESELVFRAEASDDKQFCVNGDAQTSVGLLAWAVQQNVGNEQEIPTMRGPELSDILLALQQYAFMRTDSDDEAMEDIQNLIIGLHSEVSCIPLPLYTFPPS